MTSWILMSFLKFYLGVSVLALMGVDDVFM